MTVVWEVGYLAIAVEKSSFRQIFQNEIGGDNPSVPDIYLKAPGVGRLKTARLHADNSSRRLTAKARTGSSRFASRSPIEDRNLDTSLRSREFFFPLRRKHCTRAPIAGPDLGEKVAIRVTVED
jgi:hypothetical protein